MKDVLKQHMPGVLIAICALFFMWGIGWLILTGVEVDAAYRKECLAAGKMVVSGNCLPSYGEE